MKAQLVVELLLTLLCSALLCPAIFAAPLGLSNLIDPSPPPPPPPSPPPLMVKPTILLKKPIAPPVLLRAGPDSKNCGPLREPQLDQASSLKFPQMTDSVTSISNGRFTFEGLKVVQKKPIITGNRAYWEIKKAGPNEAVTIPNTPFRSIRSFGYLTIREYYSCENKEWTWTKDTIDGFIDIKTETLGPENHNLFHYILAAQELNCTPDKTNKGPEPRFRASGSLSVHLKKDYLSKNPLSSDVLQSKNELSSDLLQSYEWAGFGGEKWLVLTETEDNKIDSTNLNRTRHLDRKTHQLFSPPPALANQGTYISEHEETTGMDDSGHFETQIVDIAEHLLPAQPNRASLAMIITSIKTVTEKNEKFYFQVHSSLPGEEGSYTSELDFDLLADSGIPRPRSLVAMNREPIDEENKEKSQEANKKFSVSFSPEGPLSILDASVDGYPVSLPQDHEKLRTVYNTLKQKELYWRGGFTLWPPLP